LDDKVLKRQEAMILSMTPHERTKPALLNASRRRRIANGSGTTVQDINKLVKQHEQMSHHDEAHQKNGHVGHDGYGEGIHGRQRRGDDGCQLRDMKVDDLKGMRTPVTLQKMMQNLPPMPPGDGGFPGGHGRWCGRS
jgi:signal recognition particle subunit SRP54